MEVGGKSGKKPVQILYNKTSKMENEAFLFKLVYNSSSVC